MKLMDFHVGEDDLTVNKDPKHVAFKRIRNACCRKLGVLVPIEHRLSWPAPSSWRTPANPVVDVLGPAEGISLWAEPMI